MRELVGPIKGGVLRNKLESLYGSRTNNTSLTSSFGGRKWDVGAANKGTITGERKEKGKQGVLGPSGLASRASTRRDKLGDIDIPDPV